ncbi:hypothetical protein V1264_015703 [Littorina saxatilis]|uniref:Uncharacterized protein n=1 Tax=Littorina saxatilis TaxID=31220 RepID=A0AAN9BK90_9CAEN
MPASAPTVSSTLRSHGEVFVRADLKNRMERVRLDKQLKLLDKDQARHQYHINRQMRTMVTKWSGVSKTTGHSDQALPPDGPQDNVYEKCKHSKNKLSEKRLMEWKVRERQLEKFLRQFQPRPQTTPSGIKPRPSSSRPAFSPQSDVSVQRCKASGDERRRSVRSASGEDGCAARRRSASAVSFASRTEVIYHGGEDDRFSTTGEEQSLQRKEEEDDDLQDSNGNGLHMFRSGLRSVSSTSFNQYHDLGKRTVSTPLRNMRTTEDSANMSEIPEEAKNASPLGTTPPSPSEVADNLRSSRRDYKAFVRARSFTDTRFFVTKDNVLMTNPLQQTYRKLQGNSGSDSSAENIPKLGDGQLLVPPNAERPSSRSDIMSVSSYSSSEDLAENVFVANEEARGEGTSDSSLAVIDIEELSLCSDDGIVKTDSDKDDWVTADFLKKSESDNGNEWTTDNADGNSLRCESAIAELALEDYKNSLLPLRAASVAGPVKKLTTVEENEHISHVEEAEPGPMVLVSGRRHSFSPLLHHNRPATSHSTDSRRHSLFIGRKSTPQRPPKSLLMKRRQTSAGLLKNHTLSEAEKSNTSSLTSAMTVTPLLASKDSQQATSTTQKHGEDSADSSKHAQTRHHTHHVVKEGDFPSASGHNLRIPPLSRIPNPNSLQEDSDEETSSNAGGDRQPSHRRRELALEQPVGLRPSVSSLGTVIKAAMVFSKAARRRALSDMVDENNIDTREVIRRERLRMLQSRASVLSKIVSQFPVNGE